jgi:sterol desaturase/sphingolipid hydroxylase (fatty acid hydroxylase superfamily)
MAIVSIAQTGCGRAYMIAAAIQLAVLMVLFTFIERRWPSSHLHKWWRRPLLVDLCAWLIHPLCLSVGITLAVVSTKALLALIANLNAVGALDVFRAHIAALHPLVGVALAVIVADFLAYWIHRAYHRFSTLWAFHIVHHTSQELDWLSTSRLHPVSQILNTAVIGIILLGMGLPFGAVVVANIITGAAALLAHANVRWTFGFFQHLLVSPQFHQWHHARDEASHNHGVGNFGAIFSIWDRMFGTWSLPSANRPARFGVEDAPAPTIIGLALHPLRAAVRFIANRGRITKFATRSQKGNSPAQTQ